MHLYRRRAAICTFLLVLTPWKEISKVDKLRKLAVSDRNNDYFCTNWPKEVSSTRFKTVSDVHMQYTLLCEIFRKNFAKYFAQYSKPSSSRCNQKKKKKDRNLKFAKEVLIWSKRSQKYEFCRSLNLYYVILEVLGKLKTELERLV